jgi:hypothetical protein
VEVGGAVAALDLEMKPTWNDTSAHAGMRH